MGRVHPQPHHGEQELVGRAEGERVPGPDRAVTAGPGPAGERGLVECREDIRGEGVEDPDGQPGQGPEHGRVLPKVVQPRDHNTTRRGSEGRPGHSTTPKPAGLLRRDSNLDWCRFWWPPVGGSMRVADDPMALAHGRPP